MVHYRKVVLDVSPRYTPGSPAAVDQSTGLRVAIDERDAYKHALDGIYGAEEQEKAQRMGLDLIVVEMHETAKGWRVRDVITDRQFFWPFQARCARCRRTLHCQRGVLRAHGGGNPDFDPCSRDTFVGTELKGAFSR